MKILLTKKTKEILKRLSELPDNTVLRIDENSMSAIISNKVFDCSEFELDNKKYRVPKMTIKHEKYSDFKETDCQGVICKGFGCGTCILSSEYVFNNYIKSLKNG